MKTYEIVCVSTYREVYIVEAESALDAEDILRENYCDRVEMSPLDDTIVEVTEINARATA